MHSKSLNYTLKVIEKWRNSSRHLLLNDVPNWYRFLAKWQIQASEQLTDAIRDDLEQQSTHRVLYCLYKLGLNPIVKAHQANLIMKMSNGDDLAFLWFLWEMYYKTNPKTQELDSHATTCDPHNTKAYSSNEQILLSSIFRLNLYPTLRELDRILPLGHAPPRELAAAKRKKQQRKLEHEKRKREQEQLPQKRQFHLPYFEPITMPRKYGGRLVVGRPPTSAFYTRGRLDPKSPIIGDFDHWFANYKLSDNHLMVMSLLRKEIKKIFDKMDNSGVHHNKVKSLCAHHKVIDNVEKSLAKRLKLIAYERAARYRDVNAKSQEARRQRIVNELEQVSAGFLERFREEAHKTRLQATRKELFVREGSQFQLGSPKPDFISVGDALSKNAGQRLLGGAEKVGKRKKSKTRKTSKKKSSKVNVSTPVTAPVIAPVATPEVKRQNCIEIGAGDAATSATEDDAAGAKDHIYDCRNGFKYISNRDELLCPPYSGEIGSGAFIKMCESDVLKRDFGKKSANRLHGKQPELGHGDAQTKRIQNPTPVKKTTSFQYKTELHENNKKATQQSQANEPNNLYFKMSPNGTCPYHLDYDDIFDKKTLDNDDLWMKTEFIKAVNTDIDLLNKLLDEELGTVLAEAVQREALRIFRDDVSHYDRTYARLAHRSRSTSDRLNFGKSVFDPDDNALMNNLLRLGLEHIATNHNLVTPTLPNVWNVPFLNEWIQYRYGKRYTLRERKRLFKISRAKMVGFTRMLKHWVFPTPAVAQTVHKMVDYSNHNCLMAKAQIIRNEYNKLFSEIVIAAGRAFLLAMRPRLCNAAVVDTFYAYLPARRNDINFSV